MTVFRKGAIIGLRILLRRSLKTLTWRTYALVLFSAAVIALELLPSHTLLKTTFVATLETQNLAFRTGQQNSIISGISGSRIILRERAVNSDTLSLEISDLTQLSDTEVSQKTASRTFSKISENSHLELDSFLLPAQRAIEISTSGRKKFISMQVIDDGQSVPSETIIVWNGNVRLDSDKMSTNIGDDRWEALSPLIEIETPEIEGLIYDPLLVTALSTERLRLSGTKQIATSSLLQGEIQFYVWNYPSNLSRLQAGEFTQFSDLDAQLTNLELTENGLKFVLVGQAEVIKTGFLNNRRDITPSLLDGLRSIESLVIIISSLFAILLAVISAISLGRDNKGHNT